MYRTHTCGELRLNHVGQNITLSGWVQAIRNLGGMTFIALRDRYGITQLVFDENTPKDIIAQANELGREFVIKIQVKLLSEAVKTQRWKPVILKLLFQNLQY
jgi:aspartyl-tRNA synthetase